MSRISIFLFSITFGLCAAAQSNSSKNTVAKEDGYAVNAVLKPYKNCWMYLGTYYGKNKILADSAWFNEKSEAVFKGNKKLPGGIYFFVTPSHSLLFEVLMDEKQHFTIKADSAHLENTEVTGSADNVLFA